jgi:catechol 2,3-dioxygenase-like lactoylglutathione lyase family enzyme
MWRCLMAISVQVTFDCADPDRVARFWADALGYKLQDPPAGYATWPDFLTAIGVPEADWNRASAVVDPEGRGPRIYFQRVPEPKVVKNRVHLDVNVSGGLEVAAAERRARVDAAVERLGQLGATKVRPYEERGEHWVVMQDPEGNEFCLQ